MRHVQIMLIKINIAISISLSFSEYHNFKNSGGGDESSFLRPLAAKCFNTDWFFRAEEGATVVMDSSVRKDFCKGYSLQQLDVCASLWYHKQVSSVITLTARRGRQKAHTTG